MVDGHTPTNLHSYEKPDKCLDCGGKFAFNGQSDFNIYVICEECGARFYYDKERGRITRFIETQFQIISIVF